jgi:hypothetical protein
MLVWEAKVGRWFYYRLPVLRLVPPSHVPPEVEVLALRVLVSALLLLLLVESVLFVLTVQSSFPYLSKR